MSDDVEIRQLLTNAARLTAQTRVSLRVDTELLETVYVEVVGGEVLVHDGGETFMYLVGDGPHSGGTTYGDWSLDAALQAVRDVDVEIVGETAEGSASFRIQARVGPSMCIADVVTRVGQAVDVVFGAHS